jgi:lipopolysaccharide export system protein LptA
VRRASLILLLALAAASSFAETITFSADRVESVLAKGKERTLLTGKARVTTGSMSISAERIELFGKDFAFIDCSGNVKVEDTERRIRLSSPRLYYDRQKKFARAQGPSVLEDDENELVLKAEWIENDGENEITLAQVAVRIIKENLVCRAEYAIYRRSDNALELSGNPMAIKDGDEFRATRIVVDTETEEIRLEGEVMGTVSNVEKEGGEEAAPGTAPAQGAPSGASPSGQSAAPGSMPSSGPSSPALPSIPGGPQ